MAIFLFTIIASIVLLELVLRLTPYRSLIAGSQHFPQYMVRADNSTGHDLVSNFSPHTHVFSDYSYKVFSNAYGCFDENAGKVNRYVLLLGDSFTWGYAPYREKWGTLLEKDTGTTIYKCGVPGFGIGQSVNKGYRTISLLGMRPGLIIFGYYFNDLEDDYFFPRDSVIHGHLVSLIKETSRDRANIKRFTIEELETRYENYRKYGHPEFDQLDTVQQVTQRVRYWLKTHSILARLVRQAVTLTSVERLKIPDLYGENPGLSDAWKLHESNARKLVHLARENGARLLVVLIPKKGDVHTRSLAQVQLAKEKHNRVAAMFQGRGVDVLDFLMPFREHVKSGEAGDGTGKELYWRDDMHWNIDGNRLAARLVGDYIAKKGLLDSP